MSAKILKSACFAVSWFIKGTRHHELVLILWKAFKGRKNLSPWSENLKIVRGFFIECIGETLVNKII